MEAQHISAYCAFVTPCGRRGIPSSSAARCAAACSSCMRTIADICAHSNSIMALWVTGASAASRSHCRARRSSCSASADATWCCHNERMALCSAALI
eukprot:6220978-Pyramimonas_sp.AAC.3